LKFSPSTHLHSQDSARFLGPYSCQNTRENLAHLYENLSESKLNVKERKRFFYQIKEESFIIREKGRELV